jgi:D-alanyl-lipoteichoic acid acyltransferase DltB (MBOAT superfamily)
VVSLFVNLSILGFFKYYGFFARSFSELAAGFGVELRPFVLDVVLPVGVSFYTFQSLSYTIDVYRGTLAPERSLLRFATFIAFFPQLVAGPIERATRLLPQLARPTHIGWERFEEGVFLIAAGLFKKVVVADNVAKVADAAFALEQPTGLQAWAGAYAFAIQIYCDFSGYTDIARGTARCLGFDLMLNFNLPYFSSNPSEFWRRWHISLSTWLRDYLYIPLGGNRGSSSSHYRNLMLTMLLGGLWHGAAWTFVAWGAFHGALLCLHRMLEPILRRVRPRGAVAGTAYRIATAVVFFHLVCIGWIFFRADTWSGALGMIAALPHVELANATADLSALGPWAFAAFVSGAVLGVQLLEYYADDLLLLLHSPVPIRAGLYAAGVVLFLLTGEFGGHAFIYFQF